MPTWTKKREESLIRDSKGRFKRWKGGKKKKDLAKKENLVRGIKIHIGKEFVRQNNRKVKIGDIVRKKKVDGTYHKGAFWYIYTNKGWFKYGLHKPSKTTIRNVKKGKNPKPWRKRRKKSQT